jgi:DNA-binding NarL/FixJ family response regulator
MLDVVIAVEEPLVRLGLQASLDRADGLQVVEVMADVEGLEDTLRSFPNAVLVLDVRHRRADPRLIPRITQEHPGVRVLVYVAHTAEECVIRHLLTAGGRAQLSPEAVCLVDECCLTSLREQAHGCLPAEAGADEVVRAVRAVAAGDVVAAPWLAAAHGLGADTDTENKPITPRELEVMALVAEGLGNKAIARQLGIKEQTVKNHLARLMEKMGLSNRVQVGLIASRYDLKLSHRAGEA